MSLARGAELLRARFPTVGAGAAKEIWRVANKATALDKICFSATIACSCWC